MTEPGWLELRQAAWPHVAREEHLADMAAELANPRWVHFLAYAASGEPVGLAEACVRTDHVNGIGSPVPFLEGLYVAPQARRQGIARTLVSAVFKWAAELGYKEIGSDAHIANEASHAVHRALGFEETQRVVYFRKRLS